MRPAMKSDHGPDSFNIFLALPYIAVPLNGLQAVVKVIIDKVEVK